MPVKLSAKRVKQEVFRNAGIEKANHAPSPAESMLERMFTQNTALFLAEKEQQIWKTMINGSNVEKSRNLLSDYLYRRIVGPDLIRFQSALQSDTLNVISYWQASQSMIGWIAENIEHHRQPIRLIAQPQKPLSMLLNKDGWTDSVILTDVFDLMIKFQNSPHWQVITFSHNPSNVQEALVQTAWCYWILSVLNKKSIETPQYIEFKPDMAIHRFTVDQLLKYQARIEETIGNLAGVLPAEDEEDIIEPTPDSEPEDETSDPQAATTAESTPPIDGERLVEMFKKSGFTIGLTSEPIAGPMFTRFPVELGPGLSIDKAQELSPEIASPLGVSTPPYIHITQDGYIAIDIENKTRQSIAFSEIRRQLPEPDKDVGCSKILLGTDLNYKLQFADLSDSITLHFLVTGMPGIGKSEWLRSVLAGLILTNTPDTMRFVLIDPTRTVFSDFKDSPFLLTPESLVYPGEYDIGTVFENLSKEADTRSAEFKKHRLYSRDLFIRMTGRKMPRIVCVIDEYFDLTSKDGEDRKKIEDCIYKLGIQAKTVGIHLIIATRHPNRHTITGTIEKNIPARIAFKTRKAIESKLALNQKGAEYLIGPGDFLFKDIGEPIRLQAPLLSPDGLQTIPSEP